MRKALLFLMIAGCAFGTANAAPGDTTWVQANNVQLDYFGNFDSTVAFPDASKTYRKIYMIFTLGKYVCPGSPTYCGDWDYTVQTFFMAKHAPDTLELGRFMTPYAHTGFGRFTAAWNHRYIFDITDYYPVLRDTGTIRIHYSGYTGGFTGNVRFAFIEGTPERNVLKVDRLWRGNFNYGHGATPINSALVNKAFTAPTGTTLAEVKMNITGHGGDDYACAEFCPNVYTLTLNGNQLVQQPFFRTDCSENDLYPQSGTWVYSRAGWCPGALVKTISHPLPGVGGGSAYSLGMSFPAYTSTTVTPNTFPASYTIQGAVVYYGASNKSVDASLEDIIAPTDAEFHWRENPTSLQPKLRIRNSGSTTITSLSISYGVDGRLKHTYNWSGNLPPYQTQDISLPSLAQLRLAPGTYGFSAEITAANGAADADSHNNMLKSSFTAAPVWPADFSVQLRATEAHPNLPGISQTAWRIEDASGNVVKRRADCPVNTLCIDTVRLASGAAYRLVVTDTIAYGYRDIPSASTTGVLQGNGNQSGFIRVADLDFAFPIAMPGNYNGNFGGGYVQYFYTGTPATVAPLATTRAMLSIFPNPSAGSIHAVVDGLQRSAGELRMLDMFGRTVLTQSYQGGITTINAGGLANGVYQLVYTSADNIGVRLQQRVLLAR